jgi:transposase-like protein
LRRKGNTPKQGFLGGTERSVTYGRCKRSSREEEEDPPPEGGAARRSIHSRVHSHPLEVRRKAVQLYLEESFPLQLVARQMGVGQSTLSKWVRLYRDHGEAGLKSKEAGRSRPRPKVAAAVKTKVVELKRRHPDLGIKKISQFLRRVLFLPVSRETVRRTLHEQRLLKKPKPQRHSGERVGTGVARAAAQPVLHGGTDGRAVRGHSCREGTSEDACRWQGTATSSGGDLQPGRRN